MHTLGYAEQLDRGSTDFMVGSTREEGGGGGVASARR